MSRLKSAFRFLSRHHNAAFFFAGFLFDAATVTRIDSRADLALQFLYLACVTFILVRQYREGQGTWRPGPLFAKAWTYNLEALHFIYGGLLSMYTILYFKSSSGARPAVFFLLIVFLMVVNEMPQVRRYGHRLRLGLYAFCLATYLIFLVPILLGRMGPLVFALSVALAGGLVWGVADVLAKGSGDVPRTRTRLFLPAGAVLVLIAVFYFFRLIPPVPLSVRFAGIYHGVEKTRDGYILKTPRPPWYRRWRKQSRPFLARPGDEIHYFVRLYAPSRFRHRVRIRWETQVNGRSVSSDVMPLSVVGGRLEGFRGYAVKANYGPGRWRVTAETEDGRAVGTLSFRVEADEKTDAREWMYLKD